MLPTLASNAEDGTAIRWAWALGGFDIRAAAAIVAAFRGRRRALCPRPYAKPELHEQASGTEIQDQPPPRRQSVGPAEKPAQPPRLRPGTAWPAAQEAVEFRHPARRQAEIEGLLRQYRRAPVPPPL